MSHSKTKQKTKKLININLSYQNMKEIGMYGEIKPLKELIKLDKKDKKILSLLMLDARTNLAKLAKYVELSKSNISRRIKKLEKAKLITGYHAFIDVSKIGMKTSIILINSKVTQSAKDQYIKKIKHNPSIYSIAEMMGTYDIWVAFHYKEEKQRNQIMDQILDKQIMKEFEIIDIKTYFPKLNYTDEIPTEYKNTKLNFENKTTSIDNKDKEILHSLSKNCRISTVDLSTKLKIPRETIKYRIQKLISNGVIAKFQPTVNFFMLGGEFYFIRLRLIKQSKKREIMNYLSETLRANTILESNGAYSVMAFLQFKDNKEFREFEEKLITKFKDEIYDYSFEVARSQHKLEWFPKI